MISVSAVKTRMAETPFLVFGFNKVVMPDRITKSCVGAKIRMMIAKKYLSNSSSKTRWFRNLLAWLSNVWTDGRGVPLKNSHGGQTPKTFFFIKRNFFAKKSQKLSEFQGFSHFSSIYRGKKSFTPLKGAFFVGFTSGFTILF